MAKPKRKYFRFGLAMGPHRAHGAHGALGPQGAHGPDMMKLATWRGDRAGELRALTDLSFLDCETDWLHLHPGF